ncbi:hypothetical protein LCD52_13495 [Rossellomorea vietnamensis]|uniref:hypothetical protein n=1 Tax=Rossellomorea vietnamensis TaxID=218284 RepID=UPI001CCA8083|nr:hypothetical protein [Rossellomorea vietnamensis]MCA0149809.1 hypothetical protein [Rossellomorea vietnamensis]
MKKVFYSFVGALLMCMCIFIFTDILSNTISLKTFLIACFLSLILNGLFIWIWRHEGVFLKSGLYPSALYKVFFMVVIGFEIISVSDKPYIMDAWDGMSPYVTLVLVSLMHGCVLLVMVKWNKKLL